MTADGISDPIFVLVGSLITMVGGGLVWLCKNKCRNQSVECDSGCCKFHSDSRLRETIRATVIDELRRSQSSDGSVLLTWKRGQKREKNKLRTKP